MSILRCIHCDENFDSDFEDYCPRCVNVSEEFEHPSVEEGSECPYCGIEIWEKEKREEMLRAKYEWDLAQIIKRDSFQEIL